MSVANRCLSPTDSSEEPIYLTIRYNITRSDVGTIPRAVIELKQHKSCIKKIQSVPFQYRCLQRRSTSIAGVEDQRVLVGVAQQADGARRAADGGVVLTGQGRRRTSRLPVWRMTSVVWDTHPACPHEGIATNTANAQERAITNCEGVIRYSRFGVLLNRHQLYTSLFSGFLQFTIQRSQSRTRAHRQLQI